MSQTLLPKGRLGHGFYRVSPQKCMHTSTADGSILKTACILGNTTFLIIPSVSIYLSGRNPVWSAWSTACWFLLCSWLHAQLTQFTADAQNTALHCHTEQGPPGPRDSATDAGAPAASSGQSLPARPGTCTRCWASGPRCAGA